jgi:gluconate 5-dehydrogenase
MLQNPKRSVHELFSLEGKSAIVIGGAGYLGSEMAATLAELGASVCVASRTERNCRSVRDKLPVQSRTQAHVALECDVTDPSSVSSFFDIYASRHSAKLDVLINAAWSGSKSSWETLTEESWNLDLEVCLSGVRRTIIAAVPLLEPASGKIVNVASMYGHVSPDHRLYEEHLVNPPGYGAAKAGVIQLTRYFASFLSTRRIRVNCISPGAFPFESTRQKEPDFVERLAEKAILGRVGYPEDLKGATALLASDASAFITGHNLCVDGGWTVW